MSTLLSLCQDVYREGGISGTITSTQNQTGESLRVVEWVKAAYNSILNDQGIVWNFQRTTAAVTLTIGKGAYTPAELGFTDLANWDVTSMRVAANPDLSDETFLIGQRFPAFRDYWLFSSRRTVMSRPLNVSVDDSTNLRIAPLPDQEYNLILQYQSIPPALIDDIDVPIIPTRFHSAIMWRALRSYGMFEAAPEVVARAETEYKIVMQQIENDQSYQVVCGGPLL